MAGCSPSCAAGLGTMWQVTYVRPFLSASYTSSSRSGCGTLGGGDLWDMENILLTREPVFLDTVGVLKGGRFLGGGSTRRLGKLPSAPCQELSARSQGHTLQESMRGEAPRATAATTLSHLPWLGGNLPLLG